MVVWLGQDPGHQEVKQGRPFVGPTGARITHIWERAFAALGKAVMPRSQVYITNAALCLPLSKSNSEAKKAMTCCRPRLLRELRQANPNAGILAMGKWAWFALTGSEKGVGKFIGFHVKLGDMEEIHEEAVTSAKAFVEKSGRSKAKLADEEDDSSE